MPAIGLALTEKMWSEYERAGFRRVVIRGGLHLSERRTGRTDEIPMQASSDWLSAGGTCGWKDRSSTGWRTPARSMKAASLACSRRWSRVLILDVREICPCLANAQQTRCERTGHRDAEQRDELAPLHSITSSARTSSDCGIVRPR